MFSKLNTTPGTVQLGEHPTPYHIRDPAKMVTSMFVNLRARSYIRANVNTREHNNAVTSRLFHDFANFRIHEKAPTSSKTLCSAS